VSRIDPLGTTARKLPVRKKKSGTERARVSRIDPLGTTARKLPVRKKKSDSY
jgi:hypothetical protein